jgi:hypothetical protein
MNSKSLGILSLVALAAIGGGIWLAGERASSDLESAAALYPDLKKSLNNATALRIHTAGDKLAVEIARKDDKWGVSERQGYPADDAKLRKVLLALANAELRERKTSNPKNYASLGVEDVSDAKATGVRMEVIGVQPAVNLIVGKQGPGVDSQYVRKVGEEQSWLIDTNVDTSSTPQDWLRKSILDITADRIQSATIETKGAKPYSVAKSSRADADFKVEALPKGKELSSPSAANSIATALAGLTLSDVQPASAMTAKPDARATYRTFDGLIVELEGWSQDDKRFVTARASHDSALAERFKTPAAAADKEVKEETKEGAKDTATTTAATEAGADKAGDKPAATAPKPSGPEEATSTNERLSGWVFQIPDYKYDAIFKPLEDMLKK